MSMRAKHRVVAGVVTACCSLLAIGQAARAGWTVFNVDTTADRVDLIPGDGQCLTDQGTCSLRAAVMEANVHTTDVEIRLPAGIFVFTRDPSGFNGPDSGDLNLTTPSAGNPSIYIRGMGASFTIVDADQRDRVFRVEANRYAVLEGLTIRSGYATNGGGIANFGGLEVTNCVIRGNAATNWGGGIYSDPAAELSVWSSVLRGNGAYRGGGVDTSGTSYLTETSVEGNSAQFGGGIANHGPLRLDRSTVSENYAFGAGNGYGGGIDNTALLFVTNSTISGNRADWNGGGILNTGAGTIWTYNATIVFNEANTNQDADGVGAGVHNNVGGAVNLRNSVVAGNNLGGLPVYDDCRGEIGSYGRNKFSAIPVWCTVTQWLAGDVSLIGSLAELGPLRFNGGATKTHALVPPSDMIDGGEPLHGCIDLFGSTLGLDQRRGLRAGAGVRCDIGAYEYGALPEGSLFADDFESGNFHFWL